jgi:hypothetical protein
MREPTLQASQHTYNNIEYISEDEPRICAKNGGNNVAINLLIKIYTGNFAGSATHAYKTGLSCRIRKIEVEKCGIVSDCFGNGGSEF